jgi:hypothetical protein
MPLDLDAEFAALRQHFLAGEFDLLGDRMHSDRLTRLARRWRGSHLPRRGSRPLRRATITALRRGLASAFGSTVASRFARTSFRTVSIATATAPPPAPPATSTLAVVALLALLARFAAIRRSVRTLVAIRLGRVIVARIGQGVGDAALVFIKIGKVVEPTRKDDRRCIRSGRLAPPPTAPASSATLAAPVVALRLLRTVFDLFDLSGQTCERGGDELARAIKFDIRATLVVRVQVDAVNRDRLADTHIDLLREQVLQLNQRPSLRRKKDCSDLR